MTRMSPGCRPPSLCPAWPWMLRWLFWTVDECDGKSEPSGLVQYAPAEFAARAVEVSLQRSGPAGISMSSGTSAETPTQKRA